MSDTDRACSGSIVLNQYEQLRADNILRNAACLTEMFKNSQIISELATIKKAHFPTRSVKTRQKLEEHDVSEDSCDELMSHDSNDLLYRDLTKQELSKVDISIIENIGKHFSEYECCKS